MQCTVDNISSKFVDTSMNAIVVTNSWSPCTGQLSRTGLVNVAIDAHTPVANSPKLRSLCTGRKLVSWQSSQKISSVAACPVLAMVHSSRTNGRCDRMDDVAIGGALM